MLRTLLIIPLIAGLVSPALAQTSFTLGAGTNDCEGSTIKSSTPNNNYSTLTEVQCFKDASAVMREKSLIKWEELKDSLYNRSVVSCTLSLDFNFVSGLSEDVINELHGLIRYWTEGEVTWDSALVDPDGAAWGTPGASNTTTDRVVAATATWHPADTAADGRYYIDITALARTWDGTDTANCQGMIWDPVGANNTVLNHRSDDHATAADRPSIVVWYNTGDEYVEGPNAAGSYDQGTNWTNPTNATGISDNSCATYDNSAQDILTLYNFGFSIPAGATIDSINVTVDGYGTQSQGVRRDLEMQLTKTGGGANTGVGDLLNNVRLLEGANCAASDLYSIVGQVLWNTTWTDSEINASTFGINIADDDATAHEIGVDAARSEIFYTLAGEAAVGSRRRHIIAGGN